MGFKTIKDAILFVLLLILGATFASNRRLAKTLKEEDREHRKKISELKGIVNEQNIALEESAKEREQLRYEDSVVVAEIKILKRRDSLNQIKEIRYWVNQYKKYTEPELDSILIKRYKEYEISGR